MISGSLLQREPKDATVIVRSCSLPSGRQRRRRCRPMPPHIPCLLVPPPPRTLLQRRRLQVSVASYWISYRLPSEPPMNNLPPALEAKQVMTTLSLGRLYSGIGCSDSCSYWSPPAGEGLMHTPRRTICGGSSSTRRRQAAMVSSQGGRKDQLQPGALCCAVLCCAPTSAHRPRRALPAPGHAGWQTGTRWAWAWPGPRSRWPVPPQSTRQAHHRCRRGHSTQHAAQRVMSRAAHRLCSEHTQSLACLLPSQSFVVTVCQHKPPAMHSTVPYVRHDTTHTCGRISTGTGCCQRTPTRAGSLETPRRSTSSGTCGTCPGP